MRRNVIVPLRTYYYVRFLNRLYIHRIGHVPYGFRLMLHLFRFFRNAKTFRIVLFFSRLLYFFAISFHRFNNRLFKYSLRFSLHPWYPEYLSVGAVHTVFFIAIFIQVITEHLYFIQECNIKLSL